MKMTDKLLRRPFVEEVTGLSRSTIYAMMSDGKFPRPYRIGRRAVAWKDW
jgi:prophage regulatory protein